MRVDISVTDAAVAAREDWRGLGACLEEDPELFFPLSPRGPGQEQIALAKQVCGRCGVTEACLSFALSSGQEFGVWGGLSEEERRALRARTMLQQARPARHHRPAGRRRAAGRR